MRNFYILLVLTVSSLGLFAQNAEKIQKKINQTEADRLQYLQRLDAMRAKGSSISNEVQKGIMGFSENGMPLFFETFEAVANSNSNVDEIWNLSVNGTDYTLDGTGVTIHIWDQGNVYDNHVELSGRVTNIDSAPVDHHASVVAGIIAAEGIDVAAKGVAYNASIISRDFTNAPAEVYAATDAKVSNHSYGVATGWSRRESHPYGQVDPGLGWYFISDYSISSSEANLNGNYSEPTVMWDEMGYSLPNHILVKSGGNSGNTGPSFEDLPTFRWDGTNWVEITGEIPQDDCANGYDCLTMGACAKNVLVIGAMKKLTTADDKYSSPSDVLIAGLSSKGPRDDGGIKPDVVAPGIQMYSINSSGTSSYGNNNSGTSYAAPVATGTLALLGHLYELENGETLRSDLAKALICHTTFEAGENSGPDYIFGWGLLNALAGAEAIVLHNTNYRVQNESLNNTETNTYDFIANGNEPLKVTISWLDPAATPIPNSINDRTSRLVNDLDLKVINLTDNTETLAWKLDPDNPSAPATQADNTVDNVEQVFIENPEDGATYRVEVSHKGNLLDDENSVVSSVPFGMIVSGVQDNMNVEDISDRQAQIQIVPNPVQDSFMIKNIASASIKSISLFDTNGRLIRFINSNLDQVIDVTNLESGIYKVLINTTKGKVTNSFIKK